MPPGLNAVVNASQSLPPAGGKASIIRFLRRRVRRKKHFSLQVWNLFAYGEQIMRAADCNFYQKKQGFF